MLQPRWNGTGVPPTLQQEPVQGLPALEINHPFHIKATPGMVLDPCCNHNLSLLLRFGRTDGSSRDLCSAMLDAMGDREFYCASYSSKEQPHAEGLKMTLVDGVEA